MTEAPYFGRVGDDKHRAARPCIGPIGRVFLAVYRGMRSRLGCSNSVSLGEEASQGAFEGERGMARTYRQDAGDAQRGDVEALRPFGSRDAGGDGSGGASYCRKLEAERQLAITEERYRKARIAEKRSRWAIVRTIGEIEALHDDYLKRAKQKLDNAAGD